MYAVTMKAFSIAGDHEQNEDAWVTAQHPRNFALTLCAVADGQGGQPGAAPAARTACASFVDLAGARAPALLRWPLCWQRLMRRTDRSVLAHDAAGFCTLVAACVTPRAVYGAACGDSAAMLAVGDDAVQVLTAHQHKNPPVGSGNARCVPFRGRVHPRKPWTLVLMTDGVWKFSGLDPVIEAVISRDPPARIIDRLRYAATAHGRQRAADDFTLIVIQNGTA